MNARLRPVLSVARRFENLVRVGKQFIDPRELGAESSGLMSGDRILQVNGQDFEGLDMTKRGEVLRSAAANAWK